MSATGTITLSPLTPELRDAALRITVAPEQVRFGGTPASSIPVADRESARESVVILRDGTPVGYFQLDTRSVPGAPAGAHILGLRALVIDRALQGQGVGRAAMLALPDYVRARFPGRTAVLLTVNADNPPAIALYAATGFVDAGVGIYEGGHAGPQHVLRLDV
ncbi:GNAT family N-acetyltransferase [Conexibacter woesei]|uniref:GNAT family N-acetyltransferase n=1 Tax=Conexibacter woesei TaxID=191495 RepID=UPI0004006F1F|nr:GNAT family N-acetyltransferase [Conexibacter woesei]